MTDDQLRDAELAIADARAKAGSADGDRARGVVFDMAPVMLARVRKLDKIVAAWESYYKAHRAYYACSCDRTNAALTIAENGLRDLGIEL